MKEKIIALMIFNLICAIMLACAVLIGVLLNSYLAMMVICLFVLVVFGAGNAAILFMKKEEEPKIIEDKDIIRKLHILSSNATLAGYCKDLNLYYDNLMHKAPLFLTTEDEAMKKAYLLVDQQIRSNIKSAIQYMESFSRGDSQGYLVELVENTRVLSGRLTELTEYKIRLESIPDDCETEFVSDFVESLKQLMH